MEKITPYLIMLVIFVSLLLFYTAYDKNTKALVPEKLLKILAFTDFNNSLKEINKVLALESIGLIAIAFILGPLSRILPSTFVKYLYMRKPLGLIGFALGLIHAIYSLIGFYHLDLNAMFFENPKVIGLISAFLGLCIFFLMSITSTKEAVQKMGYKKWKALQTFGYAGLFFVIIHFFILETKPDIGLDVRPYGLIFFYLPIIAILLRLLIIFIKTPERKAYEEHLGDSVSR